MCGHQRVHNPSLTRETDIITGIIDSHMTIFLHTSAQTQFIYVKWKSRA